MHLVMIFLALGLAYSVRWLSSTKVKHNQGFFYFLFPPLVLMMTALAIFSMGPKGEMLGLQAGWLSYLSASGYLLVMFFLLIKLGYQAWRQKQNISSYPQSLLSEHSIHLINTDFPYCAQIGFWRSQLVVSQGLLKLLNPEELEAVFAHEQAHQMYFDNFWFFWLGWLRSCTSWLPQTETLWQELLLFRELRADQWAATKVNNLVLAEALLKVVQKVNSYVQPNLTFAAGLSDGNYSRLEQRIEALLNQSSPDPGLNWYLVGIIASLMPVVTILLHK
ncbi:M56 family metallopeptidase [Gloeocapsa sp. PCC 73106]|uniref:M56 family metallopeptidase n=1 Tax=Gloeocapsa sp. PCC 73106 TaxID=102232 RepID=UPI0002ACA60C|nr:M48 family metalloprotease [Gloeocapsa sp. PCC 73106]ELR99265.1 Zn-dependent protease with chaperone function [Gloeocapsa sp. PCC 73106]